VCSVLAAPAQSTLVLPSLPPYSRTPSLPNTYLETKCNNVGYTVNVATLLADGCRKLLNNTAVESVGMSLQPVLGRGWLHRGLLSRHHRAYEYKGSLNCTGYIAPNWNCRGQGNDSILTDFESYCSIVTGGRGRGPFTDVVLDSNPLLALQSLLPSAGYWQYCLLFFSSDIMYVFIIPKQRNWLFHLSQKFYRQPDGIAKSV
jgi:hypothetical protein